MARLGKVLVSLGLITPDQLRQGVAAQILYGGRLGTNLVELGFVELDALAQALSRQHRTPAALSGHFDGCDREVQGRVPVPIAERLKVVPLGVLAHDPSRMAVAAMDPLTADARTTIAAFLDISPDNLVLAVAPELRILYHLEQAYGLQRGIRFLHIRRASPVPLPEAPVDDQSDVEIEVIREPDSAPVAGAADSAPTPAPAVPATTFELEPDTIDGARISAPPPPEAHDDDDDDDAPGSDPAINPPPLDYLEAPPVDDETGRGKRRFVPSLGDGGAAVLARISVRQVASDPALATAPIPAPARERERERGRPGTRAELLRAVRRASSRDQVAELVVGGLADLAELEAVAILVVRPPMALGWRGYCPAGADAIDALAVPLDQPGCLTAIHAAGVGARGSIDAARTSVIDERMWALLGTEPPVEVMVEPIILGGQVVCLLYGQARRALDAARDLGPELAASASIAFGRLLRAAQR